MIYLTSDLHFFHNKPFIYEPRGFKSEAEMRTAYLTEWFSKVTDEDDIYIVGDFCFGTNYDEIASLLSILTGRIHLIVGNHDTQKKILFYEDHGLDVKYADAIYYKHCLFYLSHFVTLVRCSSSNRVINLHGHLHVPEKFYEGIPYIYNVSVNAQNNKFITLDDVLKDYGRVAADYWQQNKK